VIPVASMKSASDALLAWASLARIQPGEPIFRPIDQHHHIGPTRLTDRSVSSIIKTRVLRYARKNGNSKAAAKGLAAGFSGQSPSRVRHDSRPQPYSRASHPPALAAQKCSDGRGLYPGSGQADGLGAEDDWLLDWRVAWSAIYPGPPKSLAIAIASRKHGVSHITCATQEDVPAIASELASINGATRHYRGAASVRFHTQIILLRLQIPLATAFVLPSYETAQQEVCQSPLRKGDCRSGLREHNPLLTSVSRSEVPSGSTFRQKYSRLRYPVDRCLQPAGIPCCRGRDGARG
jgi:hypothetical protein